MTAAAAAPSRPAIYAGPAPVASVDPVLLRVIPALLLIGLLLSGLIE